MTSEDELEAVQAKIFTDVPGYITNSQTFPWRRDNEGRIQAHKVHTLQALAIYVLYTIAMSNARNAMLES